jgi:uncharacterized protein (DUF433 family)
MKVPVEVGQCLIVDPRTCHGQLTFTETRVPVDTVLYLLCTGRTIKQLMKDWPQLKPEAIAEAINLAADALVERHTKPAKATHEPARSGRSA